MSQINGCAYCVDLHARDLRLSGKSNERLDGLAGWRRARTSQGLRKLRLNGPRALTHVDLTHAPDAAYEPLARQYDDKQVVNITYAIALMNAWNRVAIGFHRGPEFPLRRAPLRVSVVIADSLTKSEIQANANLSDAEVHDDEEDRV